MKATVAGRVVAASDDIVDHGGHAYFPRDAVRLEWLEATPRTAADLACPHGVRFYDVVVAGRRHPRAAWSYEAPRPALAAVAGRIGFWGDVEVA